MVVTMDKKKIANYLVCTIVMLATIVFSWSFVYINQIAQQSVNAPVLSAFDA